MKKTQKLKSSDEQPDIRNFIESNKVKNNQLAEKPSFEAKVIEPPNKTYLKVGTLPANFSTLNKARILERWNLTGAQHKKQHQLQQQHIVEKMQQQLGVEHSEYTLGNRKFCSRNLETSVVKSMNKTDARIFITDNLSPEEESKVPEISLPIEDKEEQAKDLKSFDRGEIASVNVTKDKTEVIEPNKSVEKLDVRQVKLIQPIEIEISCDNLWRQSFETEILLRQSVDTEPVETTY